MRLCIIGSGLSALALAKALVNKKIFVDLVSLNNKNRINKSRTIGISKSNFDYFNKNIINIEKIIWKLNKIEIYSDNLKNEKILNFENQNDQLFSIVKNFKLYEILKKNLLKNTFYNELKYKDNELDLDKYNLIINTDYLSFFSRKFFYKKITKKYDSFAFTTIIKHENIQNNTAIQIFSKKGPLAFLPISNNETSIVYSIVNSRNNKKEDIKNLIQKYNFKYKIKKFEKIDSFELKSLNLRSYHHNKILAFGDLLHRIHPLAGQGFNMTIRDISILMHIIKKKIDLGLSVDSSVNSQFEKKLRHKNFLFSSGIDLVYEFFNFERKFKNNILSKSLQVVGKNQTINKIFTKIADKGINY